MKYAVKIKAKIQKLRSQGLSLKEISGKTGVPITTVHDWVRNVELSETQRAIFKKRTQRALQAGRVRAQLVEKSLRVKREVVLFGQGESDVGQLTDREIFIAGVALYWGEGFKNKYEHRLGFCNSDPTMVKFYLLWLKKCLNVREEDITLRLTLNEAWRDQAAAIERYWSEILTIPLSQFTKPFYQKSIWKKQYKTNDYKGVLRIHVKGSIEQLLLMRGWLQGLKNNLSA